MAYRAFNTKYTKQMISKAKGIKEGPPAKAAKGKVVEIAYAFMPDKAGGEDEFALDRGIAPEALFKKLRTHANSERGKNKKKKLTKGSWGICRIKGKTLFLTPEQAVPSLRALLKKRLLSADFKEFKLSEVKLLKAGEEPQEEDEATAESAAPSREAARRRVPAEAQADAREPRRGARKPDPAEAVADARAVEPRRRGRGGEPVEAQAAAARKAPRGGAAAGKVNPFTGEPVEAATAATADPRQAAKDRKAAEKQRAALKKARQKWVQARAQADRDIEQVKSAFQKEYMDDPQIKVVNKHLRELDEELDKIGDDLRDVLDTYTRTPLESTKALQKQAEKARRLIKQFAGYVDRSKLLAAIDDEQSVGDAAKVKIKAPLSKALKELAKTID